VVHVFSDYYGYMDRGYGRGGMRGRGRGGRMMVTKCSCLTLLIVCHLTLQYNTALYTHIHCVHEKNCNPCIRFHNSGKQRRILTKFYANTKTLNCKQVTKFQQNRSTSATARASLVRSLKSISVHYRHWCRLLSKHGVFLCSAILQESQTRQMPGVS